MNISYNMVQIKREENKLDVRFKNQKNIIKGINSIISNKNVLVSV